MGMIVSVDCRRDSITAFSVKHDGVFFTFKVYGVKASVTDCFCIDMFSHTNSNPFTSLNEVVHIPEYIENMQIRIDLINGYYINIIEAPMPFKDTYFVLALCKKEENSNEE